MAGGRRSPDHWRSSVVDRLNDLARIDSLQVDRRDPGVSIAELVMDDRQWNPSCAISGADAPFS